MRSPPFLPHSLPFSYENAFFFLSFQNAFFAFLSFLFFSLSIMAFYYTQAASRAAAVWFICWASFYFRLVWRTIIFL